MAAPPRWVPGPGRGEASRRGRPPITIVVPDDSPAGVSGTPQEQRLRSMGELRIFHGNPPSTRSLLERLEGATVAINVSAQSQLTGQVLRQCPELRHVAVCGVGVDNVDLEEARGLGVAVTNTPGYATEAVAEAALALALALVRRTVHFDRLVRQGGWGGAGGQLHGKALGVVGTGPIGRRAAVLGRAVGMEVAAWSLHPDPRWAAAEGVALLGLEELLGRSDVVSLHLRLTDESRGIIGRRELSLMRPTAFLVNTARGALVDEEALVEALRAERIAGAGLDVFAVEPLPPGHPLTLLDSVVLSPHNAADTPEAAAARLQMVVENIAAWLRGEARNRVV